MYRPYQADQTLSNADPEAIKKAREAFKPKTVTDIDKGYYEEQKAIIDMQVALSKQMSPDVRMRRLYEGRDPDALDPDDIKGLQDLIAARNEAIAIVTEMHETNLKKIKENEKKIKEEKEKQERLYKEHRDRAKLKEMDELNKSYREKRYNMEQNDKKRRSDTKADEATRKKYEEESRKESDELWRMSKEQTKKVKEYKQSINEKSKGALEKSEKDQKAMEEYNEKALKEYNKDLEETAGIMDAEIKAKEELLKAAMKKENMHRLLSDRFFFGMTDPNYPTNLIQRMFEEDWNNKQPVSEKVDKIIDSQWISSRFMVGLKDLPSEARGYLFKSSAHYKYMSTGLGEHISVNPPPQFCRYTDPRCLEGLFPYTIDSSKVNYKANDLSDPSGKGKAVEVKKAVIKGSSKVDLNEYISYAPHWTCGMGAYYSEAIDDPKQLLYLQFGVPKFNGLLDVLRGSVSYVDACIANEGRIPTTYIKADPWIFALTFIGAPYIMTTAIIAKYLIGDILLGDKPYNYYYLEPAMHIYWSTVNTIANHFATDLGILTPLQLTKTKPSGPFAKTKLIRTGTVIKFDMNQIKRFNAAFPGGMKLIDEATGYIDVRYIVSRYQALLDTVISSTVKKLTAKSKKKYTKESNSPETRTKEAKGEVGEDEGDKSYKDYNTAMKEYTNVSDEVMLEIAANSLLERNRAMLAWSDSNLFRSKIGNIEVTKDLKGSLYDENSDKAKVPIDPAKSGLKDINPDLKKQEPHTLITSIGNGMEYAWNTFKKYVYGNSKDTYWERFSNMYTKASRQALNYAVFSVQYTGQASESFSNSITEMETGGYIKQIGKKVRHYKFNFQAGKTGIGVVDDVINVVKDLSMSIVDNVSMGLSNVVRGVLAGAYTDIPKIWDDSDCSFQTVSYNIDLVSPYGNVYSRFQNIYLPLSMLLAGALPLRVGKNSYTSPFLCSAYCRGIQNVKLGMITDLSITRGTTNLGFTLDRQVNGVSVSFTITDFEHKVAAPINNTIFSTTGFGPTIDQNSSFATYSNLLTGKTLEDMTWVSQRFKYRVSSLVKSFHGVLNPENIGSWVADTSLSRVIGDIFFHNYIPENSGRS